MSVKKTKSNTRRIVLGLSAYARALTYRDVVVEVPSHWTDEDVKRHLDGEEVNDAASGVRGDWDHPEMIDADIDEVRIESIEDTDAMPDLRYNPEDDNLEKLS